MFIYWSLLIVELCTCENGSLHLLCFVLNVLASLFTPFQSLFTKTFRWPSCKVPEARQRQTWRQHPASLSAGCGLQAEDLHHQRCQQACCCLSPFQQQQQQQQRAQQHRCTQNLNSRCCCCSCVHVVEHVGGEAGAGERGGVSGRGQATHPSPHPDMRGRWLGGPVPPLLSDDPLVPTQPA